MGEMNRAGIRVVLRVGRVQALATLCNERSLEALSHTQESRAQAESALKGFESELMRRLVEEMSTNNAPRQDSISPALYQELSRRWWGPTGWSIAMWSRVLSAKRWTLSLLGNQSANLPMTTAEAGRQALANGDPSALDTAVSEELSVARGKI